jgi:hypothetical protein
MIAVARPTKSGYSERMKARKPWAFGNGVAVGEETDMRAILSIAAALGNCLQSARDYGR